MNRNIRKGKAPSRANMRGQAWSMDFMSSVIVFFMIVIVLFFVWEYIVYQNTEQMIFNEMESKGMFIVDTIIRTPGYPVNWDAGNVEILGLATDENVLNESKLISFVSLDYDDSRRLMGVPSYNFFFQIVDLNGTQSQASGVDLVSGSDPVGMTNSTVVVPTERYVLFDHKVAKVRFILWR